MKKSVIVLGLLAITALGCQRSASSSASALLSTDNEIKALKFLTSEDNKNVTAWAKLGNAYMDAGKYNEALDAFGHVIEITPNNLDAAVDMGTCYRYAGMPEKAVQIYEKVLAADPDFGSAQKNLGIVLAYDLKKKSEAADVFEKYLAKNPDDPDADAIRQEILSLRKG